MQRNSIQEYPTLRIQLGTNLVARKRKHGSRKGFGHTRSTSSSIQTEL